MLSKALICIHSVLRASLPFSAPLAAVEYKRVYDTAENVDTTAESAHQKQHRHRRFCLLDHNLLFLLFSILVFGDFLLIIWKFDHQDASSAKWYHMCLSLPFLLGFFNFFDHNSPKSDIWVQEAADRKVYIQEHSYVDIAFDTLSTTTTIPACIKTSLTHLDNHD